MEFARSLLAGEPTTVAYTISALIATLVALYYYYDNQYKYFQRLGLKNPRPVAPLGNGWVVFFGNRMEAEKRWPRECGKLYGIFQGAKPRFVIADAELLRNICIKDFESFPNHERSEFLNKFQRRFIFFLEDDEWKRVRALQTPTFTSGKIKRMFKLLDRCADDLVECFGEQFQAGLSNSNHNNNQIKTSNQADGVVLNVKEIYSLFTMDGIATCGYGLKLERARGAASIKSVASRNELVRAALRLFEFRMSRVLIVFSIHRKILKFLNFHLSPEVQTEPVANRVRQIIATRKRQLTENKKFDDYLQILLDAKLDDKLELNEMDSKEHHHAGLTDESLLSDQQRMVSQVEEVNASNKSLSASGKMSLSEEDVLCSALFLLIVGLETTGTLLTNCTYALAFHPEVQEKLYEEVRKIAELNANKSGHVFDYDALTSCQYLDAVISETLRAVSPVLFLDRIAKQDYYVEKYNVTIPKGAKLSLAYHSIMNNPEYWPEPDKFRPERFLPGEREKIVPGSYCPFGIGPRHCLGMRFSLTEAKLGLAKVIMKYKFEPAPNGSYPPVPKRGMGLCLVKDPSVTVKLR